MNTTKTKLSKASIIFYVIAIIFLAIAAFFIFSSYQAIAASAVQGYKATTKEIFEVYLSRTAPYFAYAFILYGVGLILQKFSVMTETISLCMDHAIEENEDHLFEKRDTPVLENDEDGLSEEPTIEETAETAVEEQTEV